LIRRGVRWDFGILVFFPMLDILKLNIDKYKKSELAVVKKFKDLSKIDFSPFQNFNNSYIHNLDPLL
jgi:hypothetical protein